ncbi:glutathione peroxidase [Serratia sp. NPDC078593]|uniref:glutathione peroxidase n=1 Tax=unclassified Serratia (in: enterobacteria) TaxID=2647522 RepID=UPI0037D704FD
MTQAIYDIPLETIDNQSITLEHYKGSVLLVVNVASECGLTPQYAGLESLYEAYQPQGFTVLGFPCNQFLAQEPGSNADIQAFCRGTFGVQFPMFSKIAVNGEQRHPLYQALIAAKPDAIVPEGSEFMARRIAKHQGPKQRGDILWNFEKFLIARDGTVLQRFAPDMQPEDPRIVAAIASALAK